MIAAATPMRRASGRARPQYCGRRSADRRYVARTAHYANFALRAMYAHRLWISLWISLGHPAENCSQPEGKAPVTEQRHPAAHSRTMPRSLVSHSRCARPQPPRAAQTRVIPGIHRPYDDYQFRYGRQIHMQVASAERRRDPVQASARTTERHQTQTPSDKEGDR
jgi:hypothetical protein